MNRYKYQMCRDWAEFKKGQVVEIVHDKDSGDYFMAVDLPKTYQVPILLTNDEFGKLVERKIIVKM